MYERGRVWYDGNTMKKIIIVLVIVALAALGAYLLVQDLSGDTEVPESGTEMTEPDSTSTEPEGSGGEQATSTEPEAMEKESVIGTSAGGHEIVAYHYGTGDTKLLFMGGIHGGYEWNTSLVAYSLMDYLDENPDAVPENVRVTVIPVMNPDGLQEVAGMTGRFSASDVSGDTVSGRFNANGVDLNRNFDCDWQPTGVWQDREVNAGSAVFSEPEAQAFRDFVNAEDPDGVVVWYSAAGGVFASNCHSGVLDGTRTIMNLYSQASGYPAFEEFDYYEITGDAVNWLAKKGIPAISVLLTDHENTEWSKNRSGIEALLDHYGE